MELLLCYETDGEIRLEDVEMHPHWETMVETLMTYLRDGYKLAVVKPEEE